MSDLFRSEAIQHQTRRLNGEVILASSISSRILAGLLVAVIVAAACFASTASYARKETLPGWLAPESGVIRLSAKQGGLIEKIHVREGDVVSAGQPIATISLVQQLDSGASYTTLKTSLDSQRSAAAAAARAGNMMASLGLEKGQLLQRLRSLRQQKDEAERRFALQGQRLALARAEVERAESIASRGFLPLRELDNRRATALAVEQASSELSSQILGYEREISEAQVRLAAIPGDMEAATADARGAAALIDQQRTVTESQSRYVVTAAVAGRIVALPFVPGQTIAAGSAVAVTSASNEPLEAELYAPTRAAGFLEEGQTVQLMYQAYPHQKFGTGRGRIVSVSRTVLAPDELAIPGLQLQEPVFRLRVALDDTAVAAYGRKVALRPGMLLTADVVIDRRSLMEWLLDPLYASGRREASSPS